MTTFVLLPGAGGSAWYWHRVAPLLEAEGHEAIAVDLPGDDDLRDFRTMLIASLRRLPGAGTSRWSRSPWAASLHHRLQSHASEQARIRQCDDPAPR